MDSDSLTRVLSGRCATRSHCFPSDTVFKGLEDVLAKGWNGGDARETGLEGSSPCCAVAAVGNVGSRSTLEMLLGLKTGSLPNESESLLFRLGLRIFKSVLTAEKQNGSGW